MPSVEPQSSGPAFPIFCGCGGSYAIEVQSGHVAEELVPPQVWVESSTPIKHPAFVIDDSTSSRTAAIPTDTRRLVVFIGLRFLSFVIFCFEDKKHKNWNNQGSSQYDSNDYPRCHRI